MDIIINNQKLSKEDILALISKNRKIQAIKLVRDKTGITLKDAKHIIDNLDDDSSYYDNQEATYSSRQEKFIDAKREKNISLISKKRKTDADFVRKNNQSRKLFLFVGLAILFILLWILM